jgi:hypothetical protein
MTGPEGARLYRGTLADLRTLMAHPPKIRRGNTESKLEAAPAAGANYTRTTGNTWWERILAISFTLTTSAAAGQRSAAINYLDADGNPLISKPAVPLIGPSTAYAVSADIFGASGTPASGYPVTATGSFAGAGNGSASLPANASLTGFTVSIGVAGADNAPTVSVTNALGGTLTYTVGNNGNAQLPLVQAFNPALPVAAAGDQIEVAWTGATGTPAGDIVVTGVLTGTGGIGSCPLLPDIVLKSGWSLQVALSGAESGDQISSIVTLVERYASNMADGSLEQDFEALADLAWW